MQSIYQSSIFYNLPYFFSGVVFDVDYTPIVSILYDKVCYYAFIRNDLFFICINDKNLKGNFFCDVHE